MLGSEAGRDDRAESSGHERLAEEARARQSNTVWPDTLRNSKSVDAFLWKGDPDAPLVQRVGAWTFGIFFILGGVTWLAGAYKRHSWGVAMLSIAWSLIGGRVFLNGFRRNKTVRHKSK